MNVSGLLDNLKANSLLAGRIAARTVRSLPPSRDACECGKALAHALITARDRIPPEALERLRPIVGRYLDDSP